MLDPFPCGGKKSLLRKILVHELNINIAFGPHERINSAKINLGKMVYWLHISKRLCLRTTDAKRLQRFPDGLPAYGLAHVNSPFPNYVSVPANNKLKSRLRAQFSYICCIFSNEASTSGYCSRKLKRNTEVGCLSCFYLCLDKNFIMPGFHFRDRWEPPMIARSLPWSQTIFWIVENRRGYA